jgi:hypothetical protein
MLRGNSPRRDPILHLVPPHGAPPKHVRARLIRTVALPGVRGADQT